MTQLSPSIQPPSQESDSNPPMHYGEDPQNGASLSEKSPDRSSIADAIPNLSNDWHYESAVKTVESIIHNIESGDMELAAIFDQFAIAVEHLQDCEKFLKHHRQHVDLLVETLTDESHF